VNAPAVLSRASEWVLRRNALRQARAAVVPRGDRRDRALCQARLLLEVERQVAEPAGRLPPGSRATVRLGLMRDAASWALAAGRPTDAGEPADLADAWRGADPERLRRAAEGDTSVLERALIDGAGPARLDRTAAEADQARAFVEALVAEMDVPRRRVAIVVANRWLRIGLVALVVVALAWGIHALSLGPNLLKGKPYRTSTAWTGCSADAGCQALLFHTDPEFNPWVEFDLGAPKKFHRLEVGNRTDCCSERAVPLVAEISNDRVSWQEIGRRENDFANWTATFPPKTARYLRLRVARHSTLHLKDVALR
jgi:hypothetical protein